MTEAQAALALRLADALPEKLGRFRTSHRGRPHCALGHMAKRLNPAWPARTAGHAPDLFETATGIGVYVVTGANDSAAPADRRASVIAAIERAVRDAGYAPDALRRRHLEGAHGEPETP